MNAVRWVSPEHVTLPAEILPVYVMDSNFGLLVLSWILPGPLDLDRLEDALRRALSYYPQFAGRLVDGDGWRERLASGALVSSHIRLGMTSIPITYTQSDLVPDDLIMRELHPDIVDPVMCDVHMPPSPEEPLMKVKVVDLVKTGDTAITFACCHVLGDGVTFFHFSHMLSQFYCGLPAVHPLPTYDSSFRTPPTVDLNLMHDLHTIVPHLLQQYDQDVFMSMCERSFLSTTRLDVHFTLDDLKYLQVDALRDAGCKVSRHDALAAYLVTALNRVREPQIHQIVNLVTFRGRGQASDGYMPPEPSSAGSAVFYSYSEIIPASETRSLGRVARRVGETVRQVRDAEFARRVVGATTVLMGEIFGTNRQAWWGASDKSVIINNCYQFRSQTAHWGYEGRARWFVNGSMERYIRIWPGNPTRLADGSWRSNEGSADVSFRIENELKEPFLKLVGDDRRRWANRRQEEVNLHEFSRL